MIGGLLLQVDETQVKLRGHITGYVWVFANMETVIYVYKPTRKGDFLQDMLKAFSGVLVTDFYTAYDSLKCIQQKCLVHLMWDINADLLKNPGDNELKIIGDGFGSLMRDILGTIDLHGLKKRWLQAHKRSAEGWLKEVEEMRFGSEVAEQYRKRIIKYNSKLFVFLDHDWVPWNNNNAEHAIKPFAKYRRLVHGRITEAGLTDYLMLLSICQTCRYRGISFFEFLMSGQRDLGSYCDLK
jgi:hypothetical protein